MSLVHSCLSLVAIDALITFLQPSGSSVIGLFDRQNGCLKGCLNGNLIISYRLFLDKLFPTWTGMRLNQSCILDYSFCDLDIVLTQLMIDLPEQLFVDSLFEKSAKTATYRGMIRNQILHTQMTKPQKHRIIDKLLFYLVIRYLVLNLN